MKRKSRFNQLSLNLLFTYLKLFISVGLLFCFLNSICVFAQQTQTGIESEKQIQKATKAENQKLAFLGKKIVACTEAGQIPYEMKDDKGNWYGFEVEMMQQFAKFEARPLDIVDMKWDGVFPALYAKACDMVFATIGITPQRARQIDFSDSIIEDGVLAMTYQDNPKFSEATPDLHRYDKGNISIALPLGTISDITAQKLLNQANILRFQNNPDTFQAFYNKKSDVFMDHKSYILAMNSIYPGKFKIFADNIFKLQIGAAFRKGDVTLKKDFNLFLKKWHNSPQYKSMYAKYFTHFKG